jgi:hypothetical protein
MKYGKFIDAADILGFELLFLKRAVSTNEGKPAMNYIYIEPTDKGDGFIGVATDGRRLHVVEPLNAEAEYHGLTAGYWKVLAGGKGKSAQIARLEDSETSKFVFPNWRKVVPLEAPEFKTYFSGFSTKKRKGNFNGLAKFLHEFPEATALNLLYLQDLGIDCDWEVSWYGAGKVLKFTETNHTAIIAPMMIC